MRSLLLRLSALALAGAPLLAGCAEDDQSIIEPREPLAAEIFARYVSLGNSITAGFQSNGINATTQLQAYPVLLAAQAGASQRFHVPLFNPDASNGGPGGCPPPLAGPFSPLQVDTVPGGCSLRSTNPAVPFVSNLAVPGAVMASGTGTAAANALTTFILGGRTQAERMVEIQPTLVSSWLGNNDALGAGLGGTPAALTSEANFNAALDALVAEIARTPAAANDAVVLFGVTNPAVVPGIIPGAFFGLVNASSPLAFGKPVNPNCLPQVSPATAFNGISIQMLTDTAYREINCSNDYRPPTTTLGAQYFPGKYVLTADEAGVIGQRVAAFNAAIQARVTQNGWMYVDPNALLGQYLDNPAMLRKCQGLPTALQTGNPQTIGQAIVTTCPSTDKSVGFGALISFDGVHPSALAHRLVANAMIDAINAKFSLSIPKLTV